jgi:hypothetical protein
VTKLDYRNGAATWAECSGVPFGRAGCFALGGRLNQIVSFAGVHPVLLGLLKLENSASKQVQHPSVRRLHCGRKKATSRTSSVYEALKDELVIKQEGLRRDVRMFFSLPVPKAVWTKTKLLQNQDFAAFIDSSLS